MKYERATGFSMEGMKLTITVDSKRCNKHLPFDVLEGMMQIIAEAIKGSC